MYNLRVLCLHTPDQLRAALERVGSEPAQLRDHLAKGTRRIIALNDVPPRVALFLYQELTLEGADVVLPHLEPARAGAEEPAAVNMLLLGTDYELQHLAIRIRTQSESELNTLAGELEQALDQYAAGPRGALTIGATRFDWGARTYVMGIVNVTPDSFSGDGTLALARDAYIEQAVAHAEQLVAEGADILDIGGESTRPGSEPVTAEEEYRRVVPVIAALRPRVSVPISVDTYKAGVARGALDAGADMVNDVWGLRMDPELKRVVAERGVPVVIMHNRSRPKDLAQTERLGGRYVGVEYADLLGEVIGELREQVEFGLEAGIAPDKIVVDPGIGFGKTVEQNMELLNRSDELRVLGYPVLIGPSRKGFIGYTLDLPVGDRVEGTAAAVAVSIVRGADIVRVHDVRAMARVARMTDGLVRK